MKINKKKGILFISVLLIILTVTALILIPFFKRTSVNRYTREDLENVDNISLITHCTTIGGINNSVAGFKESVRLGADSVIVDICFKKDGTPVLTDDYSLVDNSEKAELLFKTLNEEKYDDITVYLKIAQLSDLSSLNELAIKYNLIDRLFLIGIDRDHYGLLSSDNTIIPILLNYEFSSEELSGLDNGEFKIPNIMENYGAFGLIIDSEQVTSQLSDTLKEYNIIFVADGIDSKSKMCKTLLNGADNIIVSNIEESKKILDDWTEKMQERYKASVEKSINSLSKKAEENK